MKTRTTTTVAESGAAGGPVLIAHAYLGHEADLAVSALLAAGIPAQLLDAQTHAMMPQAGLALGGVRVVVPQPRAEEALALLASLPPPRAIQPAGLGAGRASAAWRACRR